MQPHAKGANLLYTLGGGDKYFYKWWTVTPEQRQQWRELILKAVADSRHAGGLAAVAFR